jgi:hypothetical protein
MKRQILISLILLSSVLTMNAQTWSGSTPGDIYYSQGNVGIGAVPISKLHIKHSSAYYNPGRLILENSNSTSVYNIINSNNNLFVGYNSNSSVNYPQSDYLSRLFISSNGDIGIGTIEPTATLDIKGSVNLNNQYSASSDYLNPGYYVYRYGTTAYGMKLQYTEGKYGTMIFGPNQSDRFIGFGKVADELKDSKMREFMRVDLNTGNLLIGKTTQQNSIYKLDVNGSIRANEIKVNLNGADFVFEKDYKLMPLSELEKFVKEQKHLPEVAPAKEMEKNGTELGNLNSKLLQKMEEMTLYIIGQNKKIEALQEKIEKLEATSK